MQEDLDFLANIAVRMRRRNKRLDAEEAKQSSEAAARVQAAWGNNPKRRQGNAFRRPPRTKQGQEALVNKYFAWCGTETPPLPAMPTLPCVINRYASYLHDEQPLRSVKDLSSHFRAINNIHIDSDFDPPCVEPTVSSLLPRPPRASPFDRRPAKTPDSTF